MIYIIMAADIMSAAGLTLFHQQLFKHLFYFFLVFDQQDEKRKC